MADPILDRPISPRQLVDALQTDPTLGLSSLDQHHRPLTAPDDNPFHRKKLMSRPSTWMESSANPGETGSSGGRRRARSRSGGARSSRWTVSSCLARRRRAAPPRSRGLAHVAALSPRIARRCRRQWSGG